MVEIRDLHRARALIGSTDATVRYLVWVGATAMYFVASYPFQGVLYSWCGDSVQIVYVVLGGVSALALLSLPRRGLAQYRRTQWVAVCALVLTMLVTLAIYGNLTVVRELLLLVVIATAVRVMSAGDTEPARALVYVMVAALIPAFFATALFYTHLIDWPSWNVEHLGLSDTNPLRSRQFKADFDYYLPLWVAVVPQGSAVEQGLGLSFVRQPFVFAEPSELWYFAAGPFWLAVADEKLPARALCLTVLGIALGLSFSVYGILVTLAGLMFAAAMAVGGRLFVFLIAASIVAALPFVPLYEWVSMLGSNKAEELSFYTQNVTVFSDLTLLGHVASQKEQPLSYGFLSVLYRYGVVGFAVNLCVSAAILWAGFRLLRNVSALGWQRFPLFIACFVSVALLVKGTTIVPSMAALSLGAALGFGQSRPDRALQAQRS